MNKSIYQYKGMWQSLHIFLVATVVVFFVSSIFVAPAHAAENRSVTQSTQYVRLQNPTDLLSYYLLGQISVNHRLSTTEDAMQGQCVGSTIDFRYNPVLSYNAIAGSWDTPYGDWCDNTERGCAIDFSRNQDQYLKVYMPSSHLFHTILHWTGIQPNVSVTSSNPDIIQCSGLTCRVVGNGTAVLSADIAETEVKLWSVMTSYLAVNFAHRTGGEIYGLSRLYDSSPYVLPQQLYYFSPEKDISRMFPLTEYSHGDRRDHQDSVFAFPALDSPTALSWTIQTGCDEPVQCGTKNGGTAATWEDLTGTKCSDNSNPVVTETATGWTWTCGAGTQSPVSCSASKTEGPQVGPDCNSTTLTAPPTRLCNKGSLTDPPGLTGTGTTIDPWTWTCSLNGQTTDVCTASSRSALHCGSAHMNMSSTNRPTTNLCQSGAQASSVTGNGMPWRWSCEEGGVTSNCIATCLTTWDVATQSCTPQNTQPQCGSANTSTSLTPPTTNLCTTGTPSVVTGSGYPWSWSCTEGTQTVQCGASCPLPTVPNQVNLLRSGGAEPARIVVPQGVSCDIDGVWYGSTSESVTVEIPISQHPTNVADRINSCTCTANNVRNPNSSCPDGTVEYTDNGENRCCAQDDWDATKNLCGRTIQGTIQCVCTARKCSQAGTCTATPVFASSYASSACASECSSNADCGSGNITEVR